MSSEGELRAWYRSGVERIPEAARFKAYLEHSLGALVVARADWDALGAASTQVVRIDVGATPMGSLAQEACLIGAVARQWGLAGGRVSIYRHDPKDAKPINADHYLALLNLGSHPDLGKWVVAASTRHNANLDGFLDSHVVLMKEPPGPDHWSAVLPSTVAAVVEWSPRD